MSTEYQESMINPKFDESLEWAKFHFEREKWLEEREFRRLESERSRWSNPLIVAIFAAALAGASNAVVAFVNGYYQRDLEDRKYIGQLALETSRSKTNESLENSKAESSRVLEMIKTGSSEISSNNLRFLLETGLIADVELSKRIGVFLSRRPAPVLSSQNSRFDIQMPTTMNNSIRTMLEENLNRYKQYLDNVGFPVGREKVTIKIDDNLPLNAYYDLKSKSIFIHSKIARDPEVELREYSHHILFKSLKTRDTDSINLLSVESGIADYLACSFMNESRLGEISAIEFGLKQGYIRNIDNDLNYTDSSKSPVMPDIHKGGEILAGGLWEIRKKIGQEKTDQIAANTWKHMSATADMLSYVKKLIDNANLIDQEAGKKIQEIFRNRKFPI